MTTNTNNGYAANRRHRGMRRATSKEAAFLSVMITIASFMFLIPDIF